ncbi:glycosyltransferase [Bacteroides faecium]|uniref:Glycosyltransferase n=1 Tax=Bacteroides faecium TaxID=2715212 RepID=A0A6H0KPD2_9BACE|nr:glycosyltransferase [Bacteroides faecium]QIU95145.1 glycosyltransferase [Bacteroides faecium]
MRRKILFFIESLAGGGAEKVLVTLLKKLNLSNYDIQLVTLVDTGIYLNDIKNLDISYTSILGTGKGNFLQRIKYKINYKLMYNYLPPKYVYNIYLPKKSDVEVAFVEGYATKILSASSNKKALRVAWVHTDLMENAWPLQQRIYKNWEEEKKVYQIFNKVVCVSDSVKKVMISYYGLNNVVRIYNIVDSEIIKDRSLEKTNLSINKNVFNMISIGRLVPQKGYDRLIKICVMLRDELEVRFRLYLIGEGEECDNLQSLILKNKLGEYVTLLGFKKNPYIYLAQMDLFVCSSRCEGYSLAIAESMVLGIPVVSTDCSGPNELLAFGKYGLLCENTENGLYKALKQLMTNKNMLLKYKLLSQERGKMLNVDSLLRDVDNLFRKNVI